MEATKPASERSAWEHQSVVVALLLLCVSLVFTSYSITPLLALLTCIVTADLYTLCHRWWSRHRQRDLPPLIHEAALASITGCLVAISLPGAPTPLIACLATLTALALFRDCAGGVGHNILNPAMASTLLFSTQFPVAPPPDAIASATALESYATLTQLQTPDEFASQWKGEGLSWVFATLLAAAALALHARAAVPLAVPATFMATLAVVSTIGYLPGSSADGIAPAMLLLHPMTLITAVFVITDPISGARRTPVKRFEAMIAALAFYLFMRFGVGGYAPMALAIIAGNLAGAVAEYLLHPTAS